MSSGKKTKIILIGLIVFFALLSSFLRIYQLGYSSLWIDEGYTINASFSILEKGIAELDSGEFYRQGLLYNYLVAGSMKAFGFNPFSPWSARLPAVFFGIFSVLSIYFLAKKIFNEKTALLSSFILAFSTWHIAWSQQARGYAAVQFFIIASFYFLWQWIEKRRLSHFIFFITSFLMAYYSHSIAVIFIPAYLIILMAHFFLYPKKNNFNKKTIFAISALLIILGLISFRFLSSITEYGFAKAYYFPQIKEELLSFIILCLIGIVLAFLKKENFWPALFLLIALIFPFLIVLQYGPMAHMRYLFPVFPFLIIFSAYAIIRTLNLIYNFIIYKLKINRKPLGSELRVELLKNENLKLTIATAVAIALLFPHLAFIPQKHYPLKHGSPQPDFKTAYGIIKKHHEQNEQASTSIIISPYAHLSKIYLNEKGILIPISLSGRITDMERLTKNNMDYYTGAPVIKNKEHFINTLNENTGFLVLDEMAKIRLKEQFKTEEIFHPKLKQIYHSGKDFNSVWLYKF